jgi:hypothetical protein
MTETTPLKVVKPDLDAEFEVKAKPAPAPDDARDIEKLWMDPALGDGLTETNWQDIPVGKPRSFFRVHPSADYRRRCEIYTLKIEGQIETSFYLIAPEMRGRLLEARPCCLVTCVDRDGAPRLWPIMFPRDGEKDNSAWSTARGAARSAIDRWVRLVWNKRAYNTIEAQPGYAPDPNWKPIPPFNELVRLGLGVHGVIRDDDHPVCRELMGAPQANKASSDDI